MSLTKLAIPAIFCLLSLLSTNEANQGAEELQDLPDCDDDDGAIRFYIRSPLFAAVDVGKRQYPSMKYDCGLEVLAYLVLEYGEEVPSNTSMTRYEGKKERYALFSRNAVAAWRSELERVRIPKVIHEYQHFAPPSKVAKVNRLRFFGHILRRAAERLVQRVLRSSSGSSWKKPSGQKRKFWTEVVKMNLGVDRQFRRGVMFLRIWNRDEWIDSVQTLAEDREGWAELCSRTAHLGEDAGNRVGR
ncbi:hypothetical protein RB195_020414 [Necator americanus]|uniref:Uncharacterized protein n=1 Tax=Necator americanus TaxID=51031 RepID=A0ABR1CK69_NECAM